MLQVKAGDLERMSLLFERHHRALFGFLFHLTQRREASEDMVQAVFYRMLKYRRSFGTASHFTGWMYQIARNVLKDQQFGQGHKFDPISAHQDKIADTVLPGERLENAQAQQQLYDAMALLSAEDREILMLNRVQELKYRDISRIMGISEGAARVRVSRAVEQLRQIFYSKGIKRRIET